MTFDSSPEVDGNYEAFVSSLPSILGRFQGKFALMHQRAIVAYYDSAAEAFTDGHMKFGENAFSVQEVTEERDNLGFYSYAGGTGQA